MDAKRKREENIAICLLDPYSHTKLIEYFIMDRKQNCSMKEILFDCLFINELLPDQHGISEKQAKLFNKES